MKTIKNMLILMVIVTSFASQAVSLKEVVLGEDYQAYDDESPYMFPCIANAGVMFCDNQLVLGDKSCSNSLSVSQETRNSVTQKVLSCRLSSGEEIVLAHTAQGLKSYQDDTQPAGFYFLKFNPRVKIKELGNNRSVLVIEQPPLF